VSAALHQATCVAIDRRGLLIEGPPGSGKSTLALALIDRGASLVGDDGVTLRLAEGRLLASPAPAIAGKLEVRNLGLLDFPTASDVVVAAVIVLDPKAERWIERPEQAERHGVTLPLLRLWPDSPLLGLKAQLALERFGLRFDSPAPGRL